MLTEDYLLYLIDESKWKRKLASGELSDKDLMRIKKARLPKSHRKWVAGVEKGTKNILKKKGIRQTDTIAHAWAKKHKVPPGSKLKGPKTMGMAHSQVYTGQKPSIHTASRIPKKDRTTAAIIKRHETDEVSAAQRMAKHKGKPQAFGGAARDPDSVVPHASPEVIRKEKELTRTAKRLYGKKRLKTVLKTRGAEEKKFKYKIPPGSKKAIRKHEKQITKKEMESEKDLKSRLASDPATRKKTMKAFMKDRSLPRSVRKRRMKVLTGGVKEELELMLKVGGR